MNEPGIEYLAGYFDGEGSIVMRVRPGNRSYRIHVSITSGCLPVLEVLSRQFGGALNRNVKSVNKTLYNWRIESLDECYRFLRAIQPFAIEKKPQIDAALIWLNHRLTFTMRGPNDADLTLAHQAYEALKVLKTVSY